MQTLDADTAEKNCEYQTEFARHLVGTHAKQKTWNVEPPARHVDDVDAGTLGDRLQQFGVAAEIAVADDDESRALGPLARTEHIEFFRVEPLDQPRNQCLIVIGDTVDPLIEELFDRRRPRHEVEIVGRREDIVGGGADRVESGSWFVEKHYSRVKRQGSCKCCTFAHPARQLRGKFSTAKRRKSDKADFEFAQGFHQPMR